jgi:hypothetical protein
MNTNNTVRPVDSINIVTVVTDETQVNVTRPVTNVVHVVGPGPIGPVGPQGIQGEIGLTVTDLFVARGNDTWSTTGSLQISASLIVSQSVTGLSGFTGSLQGTAATASFVTSSNVQGPYGMNSVVSASHAVTVRSYAQLIGDGTTTNIPVTHNLGTNDLHITVYSASGNFENIIPDIHRTSVNAIEVRFVNPPTFEQYRVYISV